MEIYNLMLRDSTNECLITYNPKWVVESGQPGSDREYARPQHETWYPYVDDVSTHKGAS